MKNKKVYLPNGEEVELLAQYKDGDKTKYVVKVAIDENIYRNELIYENRVVPNVYEKCEDTPTFLYKTKLEDEAKQLEKRVERLRKQETKLEEKMKSLYNPQFAIGTTIYSTFWGNEVEELKIAKIVFTEQEEASSYTYLLNREHYSFEKIGNGYYLTREEAEKARQEYLKNKEEERHEIIKENYKKAKEEFEKLIKESKKKGGEK
ncbi:MAG: hypothetical protein BWZ03_00181 [bacterium ADurb.BinA186]|nr:MAG: hypothetical protein BWZ03_00181 [bacterium ADurb.BinA186]